MTKENSLTSIENLLITVPEMETGRLYVDHIPDSLKALALQSSEKLIGKSVTEVFGELGRILTTRALQVLEGGTTRRNQLIHFTDKNNKSRMMLMNLLIINEYHPLHPDLIPNVIPGLIPAVAFQLVDQSEKPVLSRKWPGVFHGIIGQSPPMQALFRKIEQYGPTDAPVVITGETGTGKELVARALHKLSPRSRFAFVAVNCTALNEELFESELFGHEKGAFTGAFKMHKGRFERAHNGTLFLDEIGDMPQQTQAKLLRVLDEGVFERLGGESELQVDVRPIAATNVSLEKAVAQKRFRSDLYHRLAVLRIHIPPLRERSGDIPLLIDHILRNLNSRYNKNIIRLSPDAVRMLEKYEFPGNIRELRNVLERVYVETQGAVIGRNAFREWERERDYLAAGQWNLNHYESQQLSRTPIIPPHSHRVFRDAEEPEPGSFVSRYKALPEGNRTFVDAEFNSREVRVNQEITPEALRDAYREAGGNITGASRYLGIHKATFYRYMKKFGLSREDLLQTAPD